MKFQVDLVVRIRINNCAGFIFEGGSREVNLNSTVILIAMRLAGLFKLNRGDENEWCNLMLAVSGDGRVQSNSEMYLGPNVTSPDRFCLREHLYQIGVFFVFDLQETPTMNEGRCTRMGVWNKVM